MKNTTKATKYYDLYGEIFNKNIQLTFEQFLELHGLKILDPSKVKFVIRAFDNNDFGHFEVEQITPSYNYNAFFAHNRPE